MSSYRCYGKLGPLRQIISHLVTPLWLILSLQCISRRVSSILTSHSTHNKSFRRQVFSDNQLQWNTQPNTQQWRTNTRQHINKQPTSCDTQLSEMQFGRDKCPRRTSRKEMFGRGQIVRGRVYWTKMSLGGSAQGNVWVLYGKNVYWDNALGGNTPVNVQFGSITRHVII